MSLSPPHHSREGGNPEQLITEHLDIWTSAIQPKASAGRGSSKKYELYGIKKLRELILELAVRGLLVPQDPQDEPASVLLAKIAAEKERLVKEGKINKQKPLPPITDEEKPFDLPENWVWCRLGEIGLTQTGGTPKSSHSDHYGLYMPFIKPGDINDGVIVSYENDGLSEIGVQALGRVAKADSVLMVCIGTIGKCAHVDRDVSFNQQINSVSPYLKIGGFIVKTLQAPFFQSAAWQYSSSTTLSILNKGKWEQIPIPVAPETEQHRIVAKVDELMALCDQLEQQTEANLDAHQTLVETLLNALVDAAQSRDDASVFEQAWQRIADHFDILFTTEHSIDQLKQTILQLAVMGKLVPQDPNDEPARVLLEKIAAEKARLVKEGKIKKQEKLPPIRDDEKPFELPQGWEWVRLGETGLSFTGKTPSTANSEFFNGEIPFIGPGEITPNGQLMMSDKWLSKAGLEYSVEGLPGDVLMVCIGGSIGKTVILDQRVAFNQQINSLRPIHISSAYLHIAVSSGEFHKSVLGKASGSATPIINRSKWEALLVPVCSTVEQSRIVAKVTTLVEICDALKEALRDLQATQLSVADAFTGEGLES